MPSCIASLTFMIFTLLHTYIHTHARHIYTCTHIYKCSMIFILKFLTDEKTTLCIHCCARKSKQIPISARIFVARYVCIYICIYVYIHTGPHDTYTCTPQTICLRFVFFFPSSRFLPSRSCARSSGDAFIVPIQSQLEQTNGANEEKK